MTATTVDSLYTSLQAILGSTSLALPLVALLAFDYSAKAALKTWVAVSALPAASPTSSSSENATAGPTRLRKLLSGLLVLGLFAAEGAVILYAPEETVDALLKGILGIILVASHFHVFSKALGFSWMVARRPNGRVASRIYAPSKWILLGLGGVLLISASNAWLSLTQPSNELMRLVSALALIVSMVARPAGVRRLSIRRFTLFFMAYEAVVLAICVGTAVYLSQSTSNGIENNGSELVDFTIEEQGSQVQGVARIFGLLVPAFYLAPVGQYLSLLLRFDHAQAQTSFAPSVVPLDVVPAPATGCRSTHSDSIIVPSSTSTEQILPRSQRAHYNLSLSLLGAIFLLLAPALHRLLASTALLSSSTSEEGMGPKALEDQLFAILALFVSLPALCAANGMLAKWRGQGRAFWTYEEKWARDPSEREEAQPALTANEKIPLSAAEVTGFPRDVKMAVGSESV